LTAEIGDFWKETAFYHKNFKFWGWEVGVENFWSEIPKGTDVKSGQINRLAYVPVAVF